jgi:hypothetical protein
MFANNHTSKIDNRVENMIVGGGQVTPQAYTNPESLRITHNTNEGELFFKQSIISLGCGGEGPAQL